MCKCGFMPREGAVSTMIERNANRESNQNVLAPGKSMGMFFRKYKFVACFGLLFAVLLYSFMMSQQLTNTFDGLWEQNYHRAGKSELTSGRWMLAYVDKLVMGLHGDPIASVAALSMYILGFLLVLDLFGVKSRLCGCISLALFISSTAISNTLSYRFTSLGYGLAFFLAVLSVYAAIRMKNRFAAMGLSGVLLGVSMSCYQAYSAVFCTVALFYIIFLFAKMDGAKCNDGKRIFSHLLRLGCCLLIGAGFYVLSLSFFLKLNDAALSSYNGIGEISLKGFLTGLPQSIRRSYLFFGAYFFGDKLKINCIQPMGGLFLFLVFLAVVILIIGISSWKERKWGTFLLLPAVAAIPVACNAYMLLAGNKLELQMTAGLAMLLPLTMILAFFCFGEKKLLRGVCTVLCIALIYGSSMQVWFDQEAMYEGRNACETMMTQVISDLNRENLLSQDYKYFFVGVPGENPFFSVSHNYDRANAYAQVGNFWVSGYCCQVSYEGLINKYMGIALPMSFQIYENVAARKDVSEMPLFPREGYITMLDDHTVVVKISEYKEYTGHSKYVIE